MAWQSTPQTSDVSVKLVYTYDRPRSQLFMVKPVHKMSARLDATGQYAMLDVAACVNAILEASPDMLDPEYSRDYTVYSADYSEEGCPMTGHGLLSTFIDGAARDKVALGRRVAPENVELLFHLAPIAPKRMSMPLPMSPQLSSEVLPPETYMTALQLRRAGVVAAPGSPASAPNGVPAPPVANQESNVVPGAIPSASTPITGTPAQTIRQSCISLPRYVVEGTAGDKRRRRPLSNRTRRRRTMIEQQFEKAVRQGETPPNCDNCHTVYTSIWRRHHENGQDLLLCNACGVYTRKHHKMRPRKLWNYTPLLRGADEQDQDRVFSSDPVPSSTDAAASTPASAPSSVAAPPLMANKLAPDSTNRPCVGTDPTQPQQQGQQEPKQLPSVLSRAPGPHTPPPTSPAVSGLGVTPRPFEARDADAALDALLFTPYRRPELQRGGSSHRRWRAQFVFTESDEDIFRHFLESPSRNHISLPVPERVTLFSKELLPSSPPNAM